MISNLAHHVGLCGASMIDITILLMNWILGVILDHLLGH
jgi:hypothetical protein